MKTLSIYILCHNRPDDAKQAIQSVLQQSDKAFELIVSDNSSNDEVEKMVKRDFNDVRYIRRQPMLPSALHFKSVIDEAKEDYFCLFHDDDLMHPEFVAEMKEAIRLFPSAAAFACNANIENYGKLSRWPSFRTHRKYEVIRSPRELAMRYFARAQSGIAPFPGYVYNRRKISSGVMDIDGGKYADVTMLLNIAELGEIIWLGKPLMTYRMHGSNDGVVESLRDRLRFLRYLKQKRGKIGESVLQDYRCSFIYKTINKIDYPGYGRRRMLAQSFLRHYRLTRYARLDTYKSLVNRAYIKMKTRK